MSIKLSPPYSFRLYLYIITMSFAGTTIGLSIAYILSCEFNVHITRSMSEKILFSGIIIGIIVGFILGIIRDNVMERYRNTSSSKQYKLKVLKEVFILILVNVATLICFTLLDNYYDGYLFPLS